MVSPLSDYRIHSSLFLRPGQLTRRGKPRPDDAAADGFFVSSSKHSPPIYGAFPANFEAFSAAHEEKAPFFRNDLLSEAAYSSYHRSRPERLPSSRK